MSSATEIIARLRSFDLDGWLRPPCPPVVLALEPRALTLLRVKRRRRGKAVLEACQSRPLEGVPTSIFQAGTIASDDLGARLRELFEVTGTRPGRVSLVIPDNLAKVTLLGLPERPSSRRQLDELVRAKMRRAVPFRLDDASISYQLLSGESRGVGLLVVVSRRALIERIERAVDALGSRVGLIDISTPNLINLCRESMDSTAGEGDVAMLNCATNYFSLVILRNQRLIFFRCKTFAIGDELPGGPNGVLVREVANSFAYYREKLEGRGIRSVLVRSSSRPTGELGRRLLELGCGEVDVVDPTIGFESGEGVTMDASTAQRIAPAIGAAVARGR